MIRAIVALGNRYSASIMRAKINASSTFSSKPYVATFFIQLRSAPAENTSPAPVSTITRMASSRAIVSSASVSSPIRTSSNAFLTAGRSSVTRTTGPVVSNLKVVYFSAMEFLYMRNTPKR